MTNGNMVSGLYYHNLIVCMYVNIKKVLTFSRHHRYYIHIRFVITQKNIGIGMIGRNARCRGTNTLR